MEEKHEGVKKPLRKIFINNFVGGIAWSLGATVGFAILIAILGFILAQVNLVPVIGTFVAQITDFVVKNSNMLR